MSEDTDKECLESGEIEDCLNQQSNVYVTKQGQLGEMNGYCNLNWEQLKDKWKMNFMVNSVKMLQRKWKQSEDMAEEIVNVEEVNDNVIDSVDETRHNLDDEHRKIVE